ncbi:MAG: 50S ribosomal protein L18 [Patescibacteria group bacterium]
MKSLNIKNEKRVRRHARIRYSVVGTPTKPRLSVFKSNKHIAVQLIDDENAVTLASVHSRDVKGKTMMEKSRAVGEAIATKAAAKKIETVVFDRGGFRYIGCVEALAEGARKGGLKF